MKTSIKLFALLLIASAGWAENPPVATSTTTPSVAVTGETISAPKPEAVTDHPGAGVFVTLTRTAVSNDDLPTNTQIITQEDIRAHNAQTVGDVLKYATSIKVPTSGGVGTAQLASIRGSTSNQTQILIDGRPIGGAALSNSQDLSEIPVEQIDHVEIVRGGLSALYGPNAVGGVINIITKRSTYEGLPLTHVGFEAGSFGRQAARLDLGSRYGPVDYFVFGNQQRESGFRDHSDAVTHNIGGNIGLSMGAAGKLLFDARLLIMAKPISPERFSRISIPANFNNEVEKAVQFPSESSHRYELSAYVLYRAVADGYASLAARFWFDASNRLYGFGLEYRYTSTEPKGSTPNIRLPLGFLVGGEISFTIAQDNEDRVTPANNWLASVENWGVFAQDTMKWKNSYVDTEWTLRSQQSLRRYKNPRVALMEDATDWLRFSGDAGRSFRAPTLEDLYPASTQNFAFGSYTGNPNLLPETAWTYDAGFELHQDSWSFKATYYRSNISNLIEPSPLTSLTTQPSMSATRAARASNWKRCM